MNKLLFGSLAIFSLIVIVLAVNPLPQVIILPGNSGGGTSFSLNGIPVFANIIAHSPLIATINGHSINLTCSGCTGGGTGVPSISNSLPITVNAFNGIGLSYNALNFTLDSKGALTLLYPFNRSILLSYFGFNSLRASNDIRVSGNLVTDLAPYNGAYWTGTNYNSLYWTGTNYNSIYAGYVPAISAGSGISVSATNAISNIGIISISGISPISVSTANAISCPTCFSGASAGAGIALSATNVISATGVPSITGANGILVYPNNEIDLIALTGSTTVAVTSGNALATTANIPTQSAASATIYVNIDTGSDSTGTGLAGAPYKTIQNAVNKLPTFITQSTTIAVSCVSTCTDSEAVSTSAHYVIAALNFRAIDTNGNADYTQGTATGGTTTTLVNSAASYPQNAFVNGNVFVYNGLASPEQAQIIANNATTIYISGTWTAPDSTSLFAVASNVLLTGNPAFNFVGEHSAGIAGFQFQSTGAGQAVWSSGSTGSVLESMFHPPGASQGASIVSTTGSSVTATYDYFLLLNNDFGETASLSSSIVPRNSAFVAVSGTVGTGLYAYLNSGFNIPAGTPDVFSHLNTGILTIGDSVAFQEPNQIYLSCTRTYSTSQLANDGVGVPSLQVGNTIIATYSSAMPYLTTNLVGTTIVTNTISGVGFISANQLSLAGNVFSSITGANIIASNNIYGALVGTNAIGAGAITATQLAASTGVYGAILGTNTLAGSTETLTGKLTNYNNIATAGIGILPVYASTSQRSETGADTSLLSYTPPATAGLYRICIEMSVSAATLATLGWTATWTDSNGNAQTPTNLALSQTGVAAPVLTLTAVAAGTYYDCENIDVNNAGTAVVIKTTFAGTSVAYKASATIEQLI